MRQCSVLIRKHAGSIACVILLIVLNSLAAVYAGYSLSFLFSAMGDGATALGRTALIVTGIWLSSMAFGYLTSMAKIRVRRTIRNGLRGMVSDAITSSDYAAFTARDTGHYVSWLTNDVEQIYSQSFETLFDGAEAFATTVFSFAALWMLGPVIGIAALVLLVLISVLPQAANRWLERVSAERSAAMETGTERYKDVIMGGSVLILANLRERIGERILAASRDAERAEERFWRASQSVRVLISAVSMAGQVMLLTVTLFAAVKGITPAGAALSVGNLAGSFFNGAGACVRAVLMFRASAPLWDKFRTDCGDPGASKRDRPDPVSAWEPGGIPGITLRGVSFRYGDRDILQNRDFSFRAGGKYAVVGESGSGKTTLIKIILGLLPGYTGEVRYGEVEQRQLMPESLWRHIACVDQQVYLFSDTVRFNITLGEPVSEEALWEVVERCRLKELVNALPDGLDTVLMENGRNLSGGQRQRIALARGLIRKVQYVILDEGTSALDETNALEIETDLLDEPKTGVILITHVLREPVRKRLTDILQM